MLMQYPEILTPTAIEKIRLPSGQRVSIQKTCPIFELWTGAPLEDTYGNKTILNNECNLFAESKRQGRDRLRETQRRLLSAALACELPPSTFLVVEWSVKDIEPTANL